MTPEERADDITARAAAEHLGWYNQRLLIVQAIKEAIAEEREACAGMLEVEDREGGFDTQLDFAFREMAKAIRARGK